MTFSIPFFVKGVHNYRLALDKYRQNDKHKNKREQKLNKQIFQRTIYALIDEDYLGQAGQERRELIFDGIEASSFARAPATFDAAAESGWEPENWMIVLPHDVAWKFNELREANEGWYQLLLEETDLAGANAQQYGEGENRTLHLRVIAVERITSRNILAKLIRYSTLAKVRTATKRQIQDALEAPMGGRTDLMMVAYDVGQANWNALVDCAGCPDEPPYAILFFDCGVPIGQKIHSAPGTMITPFSAAAKDAPVVLSHWDMDHWAGAALGQPLYGNAGIKINWQPAALARKWIVPNQGKKPTGQRIRPMAWRLALALRRLDKLMIWPSRLQRVTTRNGHTVVRCVPTGTTKHDNNNSGLALIANTPKASGSQAYTLAAGDAEYSSIAVHFPALGNGMSFVGLIAAHHGGNIQSTPPQAVSDWAKLVFSHGGHYGHPTMTSQKDHRLAGWEYQYETNIRKTRKLAAGQFQTVGTTCLGAGSIAVAASMKGCLTCPSATQSCPVK